MVTPFDKGFTLIEVMLTVTIVGILAMIGMPSMRDLLLNQEVKTAASDLHLSLLLLRSEAIKRSTDVVMEKSSSWNNGWDIKVGSTVLRSREPLSGMTVECSTDTDVAAETCPGSITFFRSGRPNAYTEYRLFVAGNTNVRTRCVKISLSGVPSVSLDNDTDSSNGCG